MKAWKIGLIIGIVWGLVCAIVLYTLPAFSIIWLAIGFIGGRILLVMTDMTFKLIAPLLHANSTQMLNQFGWILFPVWGGG